ncbi:hypothetical protein H7F33_11000 [Pedobacter sp. PAMC26386]|nr:hypothetical protein H7F33_11000 [Pedobacter sp. PAMC26386]
MVFKVHGADSCFPESYINVGSAPPNCPGKGKICAIYAEVDEFGKPIIDEDLKAQMRTALDTNNNQTRVLLSFNN